MLFDYMELFAGLSCSYLGLELQGVGLNLEEFSMLLKVSQKVHDLPNEPGQFV